MSAQFVYFIRRADGEGPVKIGCSQEPVSRLTTLMCWAPYPLAIVATTPGGFKLEQRFHAHFAPTRSHREWFHPSAELDATIAAVAAGTFDMFSLQDRRASVKRAPRVPPEVSQRAGLRSALGRTLFRCGIEVPDELYALVGGYVAASAEERVAIRAKVRAFSADPEAFGTLAPHPWCAQRLEEYRARPQRRRRAA